MRKKTRYFNRLQKQQQIVTTQKKYGPNHGRDRIPWKKKNSKNKTRRIPTIIAADLMTYFAWIKKDFLFIFRILLEAQSTIYSNIPKFSHVSDLLYGGKGSLITIYSRRH